MESLGGTRRGLLTRALLSAPRRACAWRAPARPPTAVLFTRRVTRCALALAGENGQSFVRSAVGDQFTFDALRAASGGWEVAFQACSAKKCEMEPIVSFLLGK